jgi:hypothetical protein
MNFCDAYRYIVNDSGLKRQAIDLERLCAFRRIGDSRMQREDLTVNMPVNSSSKYRRLHLPSYPCGLER